MKSFLNVLKNPHFMIVTDFGHDNPLLLFDIYRHTFRFVTVDSPRIEEGLTIQIAFLKMQICISFYVDRPYEVKRVAKKPQDS